MLLIIYHKQLYTKPNFNELFFQQDRAPTHYAFRIRDYLDEVFLQGWFGRRGSIDMIEWPTRSTNLTPMDFCFGCCKEQGVREESQNNKWNKRLHSWPIQRHWWRSKFVPHCELDCFGKVLRMLQCWWRTFWALKRLNSFCVRYTPNRILKIKKCLHENNNVLLESNPTFYNCQPTFAPPCINEDI